jgi:3-deoxy-D-arabino-heptulosonate 7-phosphate (DAHP) synthase
LATLDRFLIHARYLREESYAPVTQPVGFHGHIPAALLLIKAAQKQIHLPVHLRVLPVSVFESKKAKCNI